MTDNQITLTDDVELMARRLHAKAQAMWLVNGWCSWDGRVVGNKVVFALSPADKAKWRALALVAMGRGE